MKKLLFVVIAVLGVVVALAQPRAQGPETERANIAASLRPHGFHTMAVKNDGNALAVLGFESPTCRNVRLVPIGFTFQEMPLLQKLAQPGDTRSFVYLDRRWTQLDPAAMVPAHLRQIFLQTIRPAPLSSTATMLYILAPKHCAGLDAIDWTVLWRPRGAAPI
jgi:hypothetical protein